MQLNRNGKLVRFAYWPVNNPRYNIPESTTLCALFWRCVLRVATVLLFLVAISAVITAAIKDPKAFFFAVGMLCFIFGTIVGIPALGNYLRNRRRSRPVKAPSKTVELVKEAFWGVKHRMCPVIYLTDVEETQE